MRDMETGLEVHSESTGPPPAGPPADVLAGVGDVF